MAEPLRSVMTGVRRVLVEGMARYTRLEVHSSAPAPDEPCLIVGNHGFGALTDLSVLAVFAALMHQLAWTVGLGPLLEAIECRPAGRDAAAAALTDRRHVVLFPGGDIEAATSWRDRDRVRFSGRSWFARLAREQGVPIVPVVTAGGGESLFVLTDGQGLARALRLDRLLRLKVAPVSISVPWGALDRADRVGAVRPSPDETRDHHAAGDAPEHDETDVAFALRVEAAMQAAMAGMTLGRRPLLGR